MRNGIGRISGTRCVSPPKSAEIGPTIDFSSARAAASVAPTDNRATTGRIRAWFALTVIVSGIHTCAVLTGYNRVDGRTDDCVTRAVEGDRLTDRRAVAAESLTPKSVADQNSVVARLRVIGGERPAECRTYTEHGEEGRRHRRGRKTSGLAGTGEYY
jgi:hypothetical protein